MTVTHNGPDSDYEAATDEPRHEHHPSDAQYWKVGAFLAVLTLAEVGTYFITDDPYSHDLAPLLIGSLLLMMTIKFFTIGAYFMHLKFDNKIFRRVFISGLVLAVAVYLIVLATFAFWDDSYEAGLALLT
jgi:cytochrome c oxidase subunit IV